jgi:DnaD/phage-associated family protein
VLPLIDSLAELKVLLYCMWALAQKDGTYRYLRDRDFNHVGLLDSLSSAVPDARPQDTLQSMLRQAVERGVVLRVEISLDSGSETLYFMNSPTGRKAMEAIEAGRWQPGDTNNPVEILPERPNIYALYEANIGSITPMIAEELKDAEAEYPAYWIEEAVRLAVEHNKRSWKYARAILDRWDREGRGRGLTGRSAQQDGQKYVSGKYAAFIDNHNNE